MPSFLKFSSSTRQSPTHTTSSDTRPLKRLASNTSLMEQDTDESGQVQPRRRKKRLLLPTLDPSSTLDPAPDEETAAAITQQSRDPPALAHLQTVRAGQRQVLAIQPRAPFTVGRHWQCDYVVLSPKVSARHFKLLAHITDSGDSFVSIHDMSRNGLLLNGSRMDSPSVFLCDGDVISIPGVQSFTYVHADKPASTEERVIGNYRVLPRVLGTGTYASVHLAIDVTSGAQAACKRQKRASLEKSDYLLASMRREVQMLDEMKHPNVNSLLALEEDAEHVYIFVDCVAGGDLFNYVVANGKLADAEAKFIFHQMRLALQFLHEKGVAHRDIKPENVLLLTAGRFPHIQLCDFGLAHQMEVQYDSAGRKLSAAHRTNSLCGTISFLPPEALRVRVTQEIYEATGLDIWGAGVCLYIMLCGCHPFDIYSVDTLDELAPQVQAELLRRGLVTRSWLQQRGLLLLEPVRIASPTNKKEAAEREAEDAKRELVQAVFRGVRFSSKEKNVPCPAARKLLEQLLAVDPRKRLTARQAEQQEWLAASATQLHAMYAKRVRGFKL